MENLLFFTLINAVPRQYSFLKSPEQRVIFFDLNNWIDDQAELISTVICSRL